MVNANINTPTTKRRKYMNAFDGKNKPKKVEEKVNNKKIEPEKVTVNPVKKSKKIFGLDARSVVAVISISLFFVFSMAGVLIALRQRLEPEKVAIPTAPKSKPAAAVPAPTEPPCTLSFYVDEPSPSPSISPSPSPSVSPSPSPSVSPSPSISPSPSSSPSPSISPTPSPSISPSPTPGYSCNSNCETNEQCQAANNSYICYQNNCRLDSNPSAQDCRPDSDDPATIGCNDTCINNGDCSNSEHICYNSACRLATNPTSSTCSPETTAYQETKGGQPALPTELPKSGSNVLLDWLKAGLGVMGIGAVLLLLL